MPATLEQPKGLTIEKIKAIKNTLKPYPSDGKNVYIPIDMLMQIRDKFKC